MATLEDYRNGGDGMCLWCDEHVRVPIYPEGDDIAVWTPLHDLPSDLHPVTGKSYKGIWDEQKKILVDCLKMKNGRFLYNLIIFCWMRGEGKCQRKGSKVLMFDGSVKKVEDVKVGDLLMGDDNAPRKVLSLASGTEEMFEVVPMRGESLTVTGDHVLSLKGRRRFVNRRGKPYYDPNEDKVTDISLNDFMKKNKSFKRYHLLYRVPVEFPEQEVSIDPYFLGLWLGDGSSNNTAITTMDKEIADYLQDYADQLKLRVSIRGKKGNKAKSYHIVGEKLGIAGTNTLLNFLRDYNLIGNKHIPQEYKANSRENRLKLLAGLVDSDGCVNRKSISITLKSKTLSEDIVFLARSLGFHAEMKKRIKTIKSINFTGEYYGIGISGDCSVVPTRIARKKFTQRSNWKDVLVTGIKEVKSVGEQEYYGFMLDGNGRYVTADFTVTHNSLLACLIQIWKFFCWPRQQIMLGANSKDQVKFVHYDIMRDIIFNSPKLLKLIGKKNIQEKEIRLKDRRGRVSSLIRSISSFSGIVSNITGFTFSEIFDMKNPKFFVQLYGSIRNMPNALGVIDSTVSSKQHVLYELYTQSTGGKTKKVYFSHRCSEKGAFEDYWNPNMDQDQLDDYRLTFPFGDFERYFKNTWSAGSSQVFTLETIEEMSILGVKGGLLNHLDTAKSIAEKAKLLSTKSSVKSKGLMQATLEMDRKVSIVEKSWRFMDSVYNLCDRYNKPIMASVDDLEALGDMLDTDWVISGGIDMADPMAIRSNAKTIFTATAKGLPGSRSNPYYQSTESGNPEYVYFLLFIANIKDHSLLTLKNVMDSVNDEYNGMDSLCGERWGIWDLTTWCDERDIVFEAIYPTYARQKECFKELYTLLNTGRFKSPIIVVAGAKSSDILREEAGVFDHDPDEKWYGSPEKKERYGIQDDAIYSVGWGIYGGRLLDVDSFRSRKGGSFFGTFAGDTSLLGDY